MIRTGLATLATAMLLTGFAVAQQEAPPAAPPPVDFSKVEIKTTDLGDNVYMLEGEGGNITVALAKDGIIMVDGQYAPLHDKIKAAIAMVSNLPIKYLINTHYHGDHTGGNEPFANDGVTIVAQENVKKRLAAGTTNGLTGAKTPPASAGAHSIFVISRLAPREPPQHVRAAQAARGNPLGLKRERPGIAGRTRIVVQPFRLQCRLKSLHHN